MRTVRITRDRFRTPRGQPQHRRGPPRTRLGRAVATRVRRDVQHRNDRAVHPRLPEPAHIASNDLDVAPGADRTRHPRPPQSARPPRRPSQAKPAVLFLCVHNAGRSHIAAGWLRHLAGDRVDVFSGGSTPAADTNTGVVDAMAAVGIDISTEYPKPWTDEVAQTADVIVTMGCGDACPIIAGKQYQDWDIRSPTGQSPDVLAEIRDDVRTPCRSTDRVARSRGVTVRVAGSTDSAASGVSSCGRCATDPSCSSCTSTRSPVT